MFIHRLHKTVIIMKYRAVLCQVLCQVYAKINTLHYISHKPLHATDPRLAPRFLPSCCFTLLVVVMLHSITHVLVMNFT